MGFANDIACAVRARPGAVAARRCGWPATLLCALALAGSPAQAGLGIVIRNLNAGTGIGFDDATPALPVGGNPGTTLGAQRLFAFTHAANLWGANLSSPTPVIIDAQFSALSCNANSAVLGSAGTTAVFRDFAGAPRAGTWYSYALANKLAGQALGTAGDAHISANFNANLGHPDCLAGGGWYLGLDGNGGPTRSDFVITLLHELAHGLGFQTFTNGLTGAQLGGRPSIWDHLLLDTVSGRHWNDLSDAERMASATSIDRLVWDGTAVTLALPGVLRWGVPGVRVAGPAAGVAGGAYRVGEAAFGPPLGQAAVAADLMPVAEQSAGAGEGCEVFNATNAAAVNGRIALIARGGCTFVQKVRNAQNAGALGVLIQDNVPEAAVAPSPLAGSDPGIAIPAGRLFLADGQRLREALKSRSRTRSGVNVALGALAQYAGADAQGRALMYAPRPYSPGSSVSHYDPTMTPNQLMEPGTNPDLTQAVAPPLDLTLPLLLDIGW